MEQETDRALLSAVIVALYKGVLYQEQNEKLWQVLLTEHNRVC